MHPTGDFFSISKNRESSAFLQIILFSYLLTCFSGAIGGTVGAAVTKGAGAVAEVEASFLFGLEQADINPQIQNKITRNLARIFFSFEFTFSTRMTYITILCKPTDFFVLKIGTNKKSIFSTQYAGYTFLDSKITFFLTSEIVINLNKLINIYIYELKSQS